MKTLEQIKAECIGDVYTLNDFADLIDAGCINPYDGNGYFHNGEEETNISVFNLSATWESIKDFPYVCWYNK